MEESQNYEQDKTESKFQDMTIHKYELFVNIVWEQVRSYFKSMQLAFQNSVLSKVTLEFQSAYRLKEFAKKYV